jgi:hypothetical protein
MFKPLAFLKRAVRAWWRPKYPLRILLWSFSGFALALGILAHFNWQYAAGTFLSFIRGEIAVFYLIGVAGLHRINAALVVIACSSISITQYFWCGDQLNETVKKFFRKHAPELKKLLGIATNGVRRVQVPTQHTFLPSNRFQKFARKFPHLVLSLYCFDPLFGAASGVTFAKLTNLKIKTALPIMLAVNVIEKILWSYFADAVKPVVYHLILPIALISLGGITGVRIVGFLYTLNDDVGDAAS